MMDRYKTTNKIERTNSWIIALFLAESSVCMSLNAFVSIPYISVFLMIGLLLVVAITHNGRLRYDSYCLAIYVLFLFVLLISILFNGVKNVQEYCLYFIAFGITSLVLVSLKFSIELIFLDILKIYSIVILVYFLKFRVVFLGSSTYWSSQMGIAYAYVIPVLFGFSYIFLNKKYFSSNNKIYLILAVVNVVASCYIILFDCGTRGAFVSIVIGCGLIILGNANKNKARLLTILVIIIAIVLYFQFDKIIIWFADTFSNSNILAFRKYSQMLTRGFADNGRNLYYADAVNYFKSSPIVGNGVGYFENRHNGTYVHAIIYQILCEYGIIGMILGSLLLGKAVIALVKAHESIEKVFVIILLGIGVVLLFSSTYWLLPSFWFTFFILIIYIKKEKFNYD